KLFLALYQWQTGERLSIQFKDVEHIILNRNVAVAPAVLQLLKAGLAIAVECHNLAVDNGSLLNRFQRFKDLRICFIESESVAGIQSVAIGTYFCYCAIAIPFDFKNPFLTIKCRAVRQLRLHRLDVG